MFGKTTCRVQNEETPFHPRSPYGVAKLFAHWTTINYRESYDIFAVGGILFNHESPLRGMDFVTRKITDGFARIKLGKLACLQLGNLDAKRDWGYAPEYVEGIWRMLQQQRPDVYVLATGYSSTVREFATLSAKAAGMEVMWRGEGVDERAIDRITGRVVVRIDPKHHRPTEIDHLQGDPSKAHLRLGWTHQTDLSQLVQLMLEAGVQRVTAGLSLY